MTDDNIADKAALPGKRPPETREERLAAKLRENLRRRKVQSREQQAGSDADRESSLSKEGAQSESAALFKPPV